MSIESAAQAAFAASHPPSVPDAYVPTWDDLDERGRWYWRRIAQAAIAASAKCTGCATAADVGAPVEYGGVNVIAHVRPGCPVHDFGGAA